MNPITALIAEDEAPQRRALQQQLRAAWPALDVVAVCEDGVSALEAVARHRPRVAFLDIRMPGVSGLDFVFAGAHFDPAEVLRPGWPVHRRLEELQMRAPGRSQGPRLLAFGAGADGDVPLPFQAEAALTGGERV